MDLTVVIPARDVAATLTEQLDALRAQQWDGEWEVVVVDNGSTDATPEVVRRYAQGWPGLRLVAAPDRAGIAHARNVGIEAAAADAVAICDGDDVVAGGWVAAMGDALHRHPFVTGPFELDRLNPPWLAASRGRATERDLSTFHGIFPRAAGGNLGIHRSVWRDAGRFDEDLDTMEDVVFSLEVWRLGVPLHFVPEAVVHYRYRADARGLWRQGRVYGRGRPLVCRRLREVGLPTPPRLAGWKSWAWLVVHLPLLRSREGRAAWLWVAANRVGQVEGAVRYRALYL